MRYSNPVTCPHSCISPFNSHVVVHLFFCRLVTQYEPVFTEIPSFLMALPALFIAAGNVDNGWRRLRSWLRFARGIGTNQTCRGCPVAVCEKSVLCRVQFSIACFCNARYSFDNRCIQRAPHYDLFMIISERLVPA
uniref:Uncharacterized protein n=1 Tax=Eutreptiella gymnastica TaxID=73025 RepID=A0A7S4G124_9EUGL